MKAIINIPRRLCEPTCANLTESSVCIAPVDCAVVWMIFGRGMIMDPTELLWYPVMDVCRSLTCDQTYPYRTLISKDLK